MSDLKDKHSDSRLNPSERGFDDIVKQPDMQALADQGNATARDNEASKLRDAENDSTSNTDKRTGADQKEPVNKYGYKPEKPATESKSKGLFSSKKRKGVAAGASGIVISIILLFMSISPFGVFIHLKEAASAWADKFNDTGHHTRMKKVYHSRYFGTKTCSGVYCKLTPNRISDVELDKLRAAGLNPVTKFGKIQGFEFTDKADGKVKKVTPKNFNDFYDKNPHFVSLLNTATASPRAITWRAGQALKKFQVFGINRSKIPKDVDEFRKTVYGSDSKRASANSSNNPDEEQKKAEDSKFSEAAEGLNDEADALRADALAGEADPNSIPDASALTSDGADGLAGKTASAGAKGLAGGILSLPDASCTTYRFAKAISFGAKAYQARDLIKYAGTIAVVADGAKLGKIDSKQASLIGSLLMKPSTQKASKGKTFSDSEGFTLMTQGKVATTSGMARFTNGTPAIEFFEKIINPIQKKGGDTYCDQVKSWYGQAGLFIGGIALNIGGIGLCATTGVGCVGLAANVGAGITIQLAAASLMHYMQPILIAYLAGVIVPDPLTDPGGGYAAGNAFAAGMGAFGSQIGRGNGLRTITPSEYKSVIAQTNETSRFIAQVNSYRSDEAKEYDTNSVASRMSVLVGPTALAIKSGNVASAASSIGKLIASAPSKLANIVSPVAQAADNAIDYYRSDLCMDTEYKSLEIATDGFCNPIYTETKEVLEEYSPESVLDYMLAPNTDDDTGNDYIDGETGEAKNKYLEYLEVCIDGSEPIISGEKTAEMCVKDTEQTRYFRLYTMDKNIYGGLDDAVNDTLGSPGGGSSENVLPSGEATSFTVATYNILQGEHHYPKLCQSGEGKEDCMIRRSGLQAKIITGRATSEELGGRKTFPAFDVVGMQEVSPFQFSELKRLLPEYDSFPNNGSRIHNQKDGAHAIFWNGSKFNLIDSGTAPGLSNVANTENRGNITVPWVGLETLSGHKLYFMSIHWPVENFGGDKETLRRGVDLARNWVKTKAGPGVQVFVVGDFNDHYENASERVTYCGLTENGLMQHAYDTMAGNDPSKPCPSAPNVPGVFDIDHIFATPLPNVTVTNWIATPRVVAGSITAKASDHSPRYATYSIPGTSNFEGEISSEGWAWPLQKNLNPGPCYGGARGHAGMDINSSTSDNIVYAAHDGTVKKVINNVTGGYPGHPDPEGNFIMIETTGAGSKVFYGYQHLKTGSVKVSVGDTVKAGQPVAIAGATGNLSLGASKAHLHITTATTNTTGSYGDLSTTFDPMIVFPPNAPEGYKCT